ncbi:uncharacterized protein LOC110626043 isoform X1 [Manihot esculenta]|uniref:Uncharacterized protein n=1 Tax=Manihot esculenta TaxID=3983 RepID=A0A2C9WI81_MANES|nr:uncharacterized protein LOC110626043 isoform X1 [Manihot esculenta]OAY59620.1 hypothetical protein MANES_01G045600v8 [Manihot esculenta]
MAVGDVFDDNVDIFSATISDLISSLKSAFQSSHFSEVQAVLASREQKLKREIEAKAKENELLKKQNGLLELERLEKIKVKNELRRCSRECLELRELNSRLTQELNDLNERLQAVAECKQAIIELTRKNCELECAKLKAERDAEIYKRRFEELEPRVSSLEKDAALLKSLAPEDGGGDLRIKEAQMISENEEVDSRTNGGCTSEVLVDLEQKGPGCFHKLDKNGTGGGRPLLRDVVEIMDSDDDSSPCKNLDTKEMVITAHVDHAHSGKAVAEHGTKALKRKSTSGVNNGADDKNQEVDSSSTTDNLKMTKIQKILHMLNSSPAINFREFTPLKPAVLLQCEEKIGAADKFQNGSDSSSSSSSEDEWDFSVDFSTMNKHWQRGQENGPCKRWGRDADMVTAFEKNGELCMEAVCALYRQQTRKSIYGTSSSQNRGFNKFALTRGTTLAEFLIDGDPKGKLTKSKMELMAYDPKGLDDCRRLAIEHSKQLFEIYQKQEDPLFLN